MSYNERHQNWNHLPPELENQAKTKPFKPELKKDSYKNTLILSTTVFTRVLFAHVSLTSSKTRRRQKVPGPLHFTSSGDPAVQSLKPDFYSMHFTCR